jgi:putative transcriptional regulator
MDGIQVNLDLLLVKRKMKLKTLAQLTGLSEQNLSLIKTGKARGVRFSTLYLICKHLQCQPGELLECAFDDE